MTPPTSEAAPPVSNNRDSTTLQPTETASSGSDLPGAASAAPKAAREVELKLYVAPGNLAKLVRHPALVGLQHGTAASQRLYTVYYDTPDLALAAYGVALRVRRQGAQRIQAVKTMNSETPGDAAAVAVRREWEWQVPSDDPDISLLTLDGVREVVPQDALPAIRPMFLTDFQRTTLMLRPDPLTAIEVALDTGEIRAGVAHRPISEVELELKAGSITALFQLAHELQRIVPLRIATESKAEAGFSLVTGALPRPSKAPPLALTPAATVSESFRHVVRNCMSHALANHACAVAGLEAEGIHQMRISLRRLRSALGLFDDVIASADARTLKEEVKWLAERLGPARDWDILQTQFFEPYAEKQGSDEGVRLLGQAIADSRRSAHARAVEALHAPRYTTLMLGLGDWLESGRWNEDAAPDVKPLLVRPMADLAGIWLDLRHRKSRKSGRQIRKLDPDQRHRLRISFKKLRYAVEFFRGLYPPGAVRPYLEAVEALQDLLGTLNDAAVSRRMIDALSADAGRDVRRAAGDFSDWLERRMRRHTGDLPERWRDYERVEPFWG